MLAIVAAMQRGAEPKKESDFIILVPPYDPAEIFSPSYGHDEPEAARESATFPSLRCAWLPAQIRMVRRMSKVAAGTIARECRCRADKLRGAFRIVCGTAGLLGGRSRGEWRRRPPGSRSRGR